MPFFIKVLKHWLDVLAIRWTCKVLYNRNIYGNIIIYIDSQMAFLSLILYSTSSRLEHYLPSPCFARILLLIESTTLTSEHTVFRICLCNI